MLSNIARTDLFGFPKGSVFYCWDEKLLLVLVTEKGIKFIMYLEKDKYTPVADFSILERKQVMP